MPTGRPQSLPALSDQQQIILRFVVYFFCLFRKPPTGPVIEQNLGIATSLVYVQLKQMAKKGWIIREDRKHQAIKLSPQAIRFVTGANPLRFRSAKFCKEMAEKLAKENGYEQGFNLGEINERDD